MEQTAAPKSAPAFDFQDQDIIARYLTLFFIGLSYKTVE